MFKLIFIVLTVFSFVEPDLGSLLLVVFLLIFEGILYYASNSVKYHPKDLWKWSKEEKDAFERFKLFLRYPQTATKLSKTLSLVQLVSLPLAAWFAYKQIYVGTVLLLVNYPVAGNLSQKLNPKLLTALARKKKGDTKLFNELDALGKVAKRIRETKID